MARTIKITATIGDYFKDNIIDALKISSQQNKTVELQWMEEVYIIKPSSTYDDIMLYHRKIRSETLDDTNIARQAELDYLIDILPESSTNLDDLLTVLEKYCNYTTDTTLVTRRWKVIQFFKDIGFPPNNKNLGACPLKMMTVELLIGSIMGNLIAKDYFLGAGKFIPEFKKSEQYENASKIFNRKNTIDQLLKEL